MMLLVQRMKSYKDINAKTKRSERNTSVRLRSSRTACEVGLPDISEVHTNNPEFTILLKLLYFSTNVSQVATLWVLIMFTNF